MIYTPMLYHDHNEFIQVDIFLNGIKVFEKVIPALGNVEWDIIKNKNLSNYSKKKLVCRRLVLNVFSMCSNRNKYKFKWCYNITISIYKSKYKQIKQNIISYNFTSICNRNKNMEIKYYVKSTVFILVFIFCVYFDVFYRWNEIKLNCRTVFYKIKCKYT